MQNNLQLKKIISTLIGVYSLIPFFISSADLIKKLK